MIHVDVVETGKNIRQMVKSAGYTAYDVQHVCGFSTPAAVYKWFEGKSMPTIDNLVIVADLLKCRMDDIVVVGQ